jgi:hypothetical protein
MRAREYGSFDDNLVNARRRLKDFSYVRSFLPRLRCSGGDGLRVGRLILARYGWRAEAGADPGGHQRPTPSCPLRGST